MAMKSATGALCLAGPTASGKTAVVLALAERLPIEIVSVDSALVYRGMDIGTAKPTAEECQRVPHHLIDILDPSQTYSAARFVVDAQRLVREIRARGHHPVLVGGTMLYFRALREGLHQLPPANAELRAELDAQADRLGWPALHAQLRAVDSETAARLAPNDAQRIQRALEVWYLSGQPLSAWHRLAPLHAPSRSDWPLVSLEPADRAWLHQRIAQRLQQMAEQGFLAEVQALRARGDLNAQMPSMRCVGYRQAWAALQSAAPTPPFAGSASPDSSQWLPQALAATRQLAKRQLTWLRSVPEREVVACDAPSAQTDATLLLQKYLQKPP